VMLDPEEDQGVHVFLRRGVAILGVLLLNPCLPASRAAIDEMNSLILEASFERE
jgi:hypothetical protein